MVENEVIYNATGEGQTTTLAWLQTIVVNCASEKANAKVIQENKRQSELFVKGD
jgi:hypothetical protein